MLTPELAKEELNKFRSSRFVDQRIARLEQVPEAIRAEGRTLFGLESVDEKSPIQMWKVQQELREKRTAAYQKLSSEQLESLIKTLLPELAVYINRALKTMARQPYTNGHGRKPFRSSAYPVLYESQRRQFLLSLFDDMQKYPPQIEWIAAWAPHAWPYGGVFAGRLLAAAIDENDDAGKKVFDILIASARGEHEIGRMGRHVITGLLSSGRTEGWEFIEKLLLAAQREEGLRQSILEFIDEGHPDAFVRFLRIVLENDLVRFSATVRAVDVWFGFLWDAMSTGKARKILEHALTFLTDPAAGDLAIKQACDLPSPKEPAKKSKKLVEADEAVEPAYIAVWSKAFVEVKDTFEPIGRMLRAANADVRFVAVHLLGQLNLSGNPSKLLAGMLDDANEAVAARALLHFNHRQHHGRQKPDAAVPDLFERLEKLIGRAPEKTVKLTPIVWPWMQLSWGKQTVAAALIAALGDRPVTRLLPHTEHFDADSRLRAVQKIVAADKTDAATRHTLLELAGDASTAVRNAVLTHLKKVSVSEAEAPQLEGFLTRKAPDLRRALLTVLLNQSDTAALASARRLLPCKDELQRVGGLELLRELAKANRSAAACRQAAVEYGQVRGELSNDEQTQINALLESSTDAVTLDNCLGLIDPTMRTRPLVPSEKAVVCFSSAAMELVQSLDALVHEHREKEFTPRNRAGATVEPVLLGNANWQFPRVKADKPAKQQLEQLPFREIWLQWFEARPSSMRDSDGLELLRARWIPTNTNPYGGDSPEAIDWLAAIEKRLCGADRPKIRYHVTRAILDWLCELFPSEHEDRFYLDGLELALSLLPPDKLAATEKRPWGQGDEVIWRKHSSVVMRWLAQIGTGAKLKSDADKVRFYSLHRWIDEPGVPIPRHRPGLKTLLAALDAGGATNADLFDHFIGPRSQDSSHGAHSDLGQYSSLKPHDRLEKHPALPPVIDACRKRVLEVELLRGETPTCVSSIANSLKYSGGLEILVPFLKASENSSFKRGHSFGTQSRASVFSHIIRATYPSEQQTPGAFAAAMKDAGIGEARLLELATYAPQWSEHVQETLGWPYLVEAVWWIRAHTRDRSWTVDAALKEKWNAQVAQRTPLESEDLLDGAVDVAWFNRVFEGLGRKRWAALYDVAKFAASGGGHIRAQMFADAMLGQVTAKELVTRIESKRNQDAVRALGLLPLPKGDKARGQMLSRYKTLQEFIRTSRQFGSMRQTSEKRAAAIGMENLARTAGYPDPIRLQWAMEASACADLVKGPAIAKVGEVTVSLSISDQGEVELSTAKKGKELATIPPAVKKNKAVAELASRKTDLKRSASRMRLSLEQAMVRGDIFSAEELRELLTNPLLAPMLKRLVFSGEGIMGYPVDGGQGLIDASGKIEPLKKGESVRLSHPHDLLKAGNWSQWQHDCFRAERIQPFKQVFRELYVLTKAESDAKEVSRRYAGHQVQPKQALALLGSRGWVTAPEQGVFRTFHELGLTVWLTFQQSFFTPADIEGLTLEGVRFTRKSESIDWVQLSEVPPRIFSEVMRDLDLVVSVAHRGGVDPEASASTVQMRTSLLSETMHLLGLKNVRLKDSHAFIKGKLADYTLHLGSAVTHRQPGGALFIVPVHSQHRGRLFLPFADDDPKTAEVISKVLLLARDGEIKDPNLLAQIAN